MTKLVPIITIHNYVKLNYFTFMKVFYIDIHTVYDYDVSCRSL